MTATVSPKRNDVYTALRALLQGIVGGNPPPQVIIGLGNRVPMPNAPFIAITTIGTARLDTNVDTDTDGYPLLPGTTSSEQATRMDLQFDFYGPQSNSWATMVSTLFRDDYSFEILAPVCAPFYADDPIMVPLISAENQYLQRWTVTAAIQYNPVTVTAQDFSTTLDIVPINVDEEFPPAA
jgi:hypothetical protein